MRKQVASIDNISKQSVSCCSTSRALTALALLSVFVTGAWSAYAADAVLMISTRPLTPQERKAVTNVTQLASGLANTGVGQPLYLEALVTSGTVVTNFE